MELRKKINIAITSIFLFTVAAMTIANTSDKIVFSDSDQDGLSDEEEMAYGTDPANPDSDGDSYSDGTEVKSGYDPLKPAPGDKIVSENESAEKDALKNIPQNGPVASKFQSDIEDFIKSKENEPITQQDVQSFVSESLVDVLKGTSEEDLPEIDSSDLQIVKQKYKDLSDSEKFEQRKEDWQNYNTNLSTMYASALSTDKMEVKNSATFQKAINELFDKYGDIMKGGKDFDYFRNLAPGFEKFVDEGKKMQVPEEVVDMHIKLLRIISAFLDLRDPSLPKIEEDSMVKISVFAKLKGLNKILTDFMVYEFDEYDKQFLEQER